jgi:hypothetical protein
MAKLIGSTQFQTVTPTALSGESVVTSVPINTRLIILAQNTGTGTSTLTIESTPDSQGRTGDLVASIASQAWGVSSIFGKSGWRQADQTVHVKGPTTMNIFVLEL